MAEREEGGFMGQIRRLSRRLSGNILSADPRDVRAYMARNDNKRNIYSYDNEDQLRIGGILLRDLAEEFGTPLYVYDINRIYDNYNLLTKTLKKKNFSLNYSVRSNPNLAILNILSRLGSGFDVASGGEITRCLAAGVDPSRMIFSGAGKTNDELDLAIRSGVFCINAESWDELNRIENICVKYNKIQNVSIRINTDAHVEGSSPGMHSHPMHQQTKYGVPLSDALEIYSRVKASSTMRIKGISCRIGTNVTHIENYLEIRDKLLHLADELRQESRICVEHIDFGGEFIGNLNAMNADASEISNWIEKIATPILERGLKLILDPGVNFMADTGVLLTRIEYIKTNVGQSKESLSGASTPRSGSFIGSHGGNFLKHHYMKRTFAIVDAGFNDFARTALLAQNHLIAPIHQQQSITTPSGALAEFKYDIVGPINDSIDVFYRDLTLHYKLNSGDYLIISDAGSYGSSLGNNFQSRNKPTEIIIIERQPIVIREREKYEQQYLNEKLISEIKLNSTKIIEEAESQEDLEKAIIEEQSSSTTATTDVTTE